MINQDQVIFTDLSVDTEPISLKFRKGLFSSQIVIFKAQR